MWGEWDRFLIGCQGSPHSESDIWTRQSGNREWARGVFGRRILQAGRTKSKGLEGLNRLWVLRKQWGSPSGPNTVRDQSTAGDELRETVSLRKDTDYVRPYRTSFLLTRTFFYWGEEGQWNINSEDANKRSVPRSDLYSNFYFRITLFPLLKLCYTSERLL